MRIPFLDTPAFWFIMLFLFAFTPSFAEAQSDRGSPDPGFYIGVSYVDSDIDDDIADTSGDGEGSWPAIVSIMD